LGRATRHTRAKFFEVEAASAVLQNQGAATTAIRDANELTRQLRCRGNRHSRLRNPALDYPLPGFRSQNLIFRRERIAYWQCYDLSVF
jgi:hypothetical protein